MNLLLIAHGTRDPAGAVVTERVAERARRLLGVPVHACYADVRGPTPADVLAEITLPTYPTTVDRAAQEKLAAAAQEYGVLSQAPDLDELLP